MKKMKRILNTYVFCSLIVACNQGKSDSAKKAPRKTESVKPAGQKLCKTNKVSEILDDGRTVVSRSPIGESSLYIWDSFSKKLKQRIDYLFQFKKISHNGEYYLRSFGASNRRFQLLKFKDNNIVYNERITLTGSKAPLIEFSRSSDHIVFAYQRSGSTTYSRLLVFDINKKDYIIGKNYSGIKHIAMIDDERVLVVREGRNQAVLLNPLTGEESTINLPFGRINELHVSNSMFLIKIRDTFLAYDLHSGNHIYSQKLSSIYSHSFEAEKALVSTDWKDLYLMDLRTGDRTSITDAPKEVLLSSCKFTSDTLTSVCMDKVNQGKIFLWDLQTNKGETVCY